MSDKFDLESAGLNGPLRTSRLGLRPLTTGDIDALWPFVSDPDLPKFMTWNAHRERAETAQFVAGVVAARESGTGYVWSIQRDQGLCGIVGLHDVTRTMRAWRQDRAELGYWCGPQFQNQGFVTEAAREVLRFGFEDIHLHKITSGCISDNAASRRVLEKLGFRLVGEQRDHMFRFDRWWDHLSYELIVNDWRP